MADLNDLEELDLELPDDLDELDIGDNNLEDLDLDTIDSSESEINPNDEIDEFEELISDDSADSKKTDSNVDSNKETGDNKKSQSNNIMKYSIMGISSLALIGASWFGYKYLVINDSPAPSNIMAQNKAKDVMPLAENKTLPLPKKVEEKAISKVVHTNEEKISSKSAATNIKTKQPKNNEKLLDIVNLIKKNNKELNDKISISVEKNNMEISKLTKDIIGIEDKITEAKSALSKSIENTDLELAKIQNKAIEMSAILNNANDYDLDKLQQLVDANKNAAAQAIKGVELINQNKDNALIDALNKKISNLEIDFSTMHESINSKDKEIAILKNDIKLLNADIEKVAKVKEKSIDNFQTFEIVGFDGTNKSVWLRDSNNNVIKVEKGTFIPEYGTAISILEDGNIVTRLGLVKIILKD